MYNLLLNYANMLNYTNENYFSNLTNFRGQPKFFQNQVSLSKVVHVQYNAL
jgi:hypothetical protein